MKVKIRMLEKYMQEEWKQIKISNLTSGNYVAPQGRFADVWMHAGVKDGKSKGI